jgi:hypothetical protein
LSSSGIRKEIKLKTKLELGDVVVCTNAILAGEGLKKSVREKFLIIREVSRLMRIQSLKQ